MDKLFEDFSFARYVFDQKFADWINSSRTGIFLR